MFKATSPTKMFVIVFSFLARFNQGDDGPIECDDPSLIQNKKEMHVKKNINENDHSSSTHACPSAKDGFTCDFESRFSHRNGDNRSMREHYG